METTVLTSIGGKLGIKSDKVLRKAAEYMALADIRSASSSLTALGLSGSCKAVLCLQLAAQAHGEPFDKDTALRVSGMKNRKLYFSGLRALECLLDLQPQTSIPDLAVQFGCTSSRSLAVSIRQKYEAQQTVSDSTEYSQVLFNIAALYTACRRQKVRVDKTKLVDTAGVKRPTFDRLVAQMDKVAEQISQGDKRKVGSKRSKSLMDEIEIMADQSDATAKTSWRADQGVTGDGEDEPYAAWKTRILTEAYRALGKVYSPVT